MGYCTNCGASNADDARFCTSCGAPANSAPAEQPSAPPAAVVEPQPQPPAPVAPPRKKRTALLVVVILVVLGLIACGAAAGAALLVFTPERAVADLAQAVGDGDEAAAAKLLTADLGGRMAGSGGVLEGLEASAIAEHAGSLEPGASTLTAATLSAEGADYSLALELERSGIGWKVGAIRYSATETVTEKTELEAQRHETETLPDGVTITASEGTTGRTSITRERVVTDGEIEDSVLDETVLEEATPRVEWVGIGDASPYAADVNSPAAGDYLDRSTWIVTEPKSVISADASEVAASFSIEPITSDMEFTLAWLLPSGEQSWGTIVYPQSDWTYINVGWWTGAVEPGHWTACLLINGRPASYVEFDVE